MPTDRRRFIQRLTSGAAAASMLPLVPGALHAADTTSSRATSRATSGGMRDEIDAAFVAEEWDTSWTARLTGRHKAVFDVPETDGGSGVFRSGLWLRQYGEVLNAAPADLNNVIVLRHHAIILAMSPAFWAEYDLGRKHKILHPVTEKKSALNPAMLGVADGAPESFASLALDRQIANGAIVLACGLALSSMTREVAKKHKVPTPEARAIARAAMVPGVILQPSGFFATTLAQEKGCIYVRGS